MSKYAGLSHAALKANIEYFDANPHLYRHGSDRSDCWQALHGEKINKRIAEINTAIRMTTANQKPVASR